MSKVFSAFFKIPNTSSTKELSIQVIRSSLYLSLKNGLRVSQLVRIEENLLFKLLHGCVILLFLKWQVNYYTEYHLTFSLTLQRCYC